MEQLKLLETFRQMKACIQEHEPEVAAAMDNDASSDDSPPILEDIE